MAITGLLGLLFLLMVVATILAAVGMRSRFRRNAQGLSDALRSVLPQVPTEIHLRPEPKPEWKDRTAVDAAVAALGKNGFQRIGAFTSRELPGTIMLAFVEPDIGMYATITEVPAAQLVWADIFSFYAGGGRFLCTSSPVAAKHEARPGTDRWVLPEVSVEALFREAMQRRPMKPLIEHDAASFTALFEKSYREEQAWRAERGIAPPQLRAVTANTPVPIPGSAKLEAEAAQWHLELERQLLAEFHREYGLKPEERMQYEGRLVAVHDDLSPSALVSLLERRMQRTLPFAPNPQLSPRKAFAEMNAMLPEDLQLRPLGSVEAPREADIYGWKG